MTSHTDLRTRGPRLGYCRDCDAGTRGISWTGRFPASLLLLLIVASLLVSFPRAAEPRTGLVTGPPRHPDGAIGRASLSVATSYVSVFSDSWSGGRDHQNLHAALSVVVHPQASLQAEYTLFDPGLSHHRFLAGPTLYLRNPLAAAGSVNPDGPVGSPVISLLGGVRFHTDADSAAIALADVRVLVPVSTRLSFGAGYRWQDETSPDRAVAAYGLLAIYPRPYPPDSAWANPDGPVGVPVLRLDAGAADRTWGASAHVLLPIQADLTLAASFQTERLAFPERTAYTARLGFTWHLTR